MKNEQSFVQLLRCPIFKILEYSSILWF